MIEEKQRHERRRQVEAVKRHVRDANSRGLHLPGLWACRMAAGLSQRDLATAIGSNQATIHELERSLRGAYPKTVRSLCAALLVEPADLLCAEATEAR
jgi:transcriptional regulator with XRE-family HTH domain